MSFRLTFFLSMVLVLQPLSPAQADSGSAQAEAPVPNDPLELVTGAAEPVQNADQRLAAVNLLKSARSLSNVRGQPYDLKTTFSASGSPSSDGVWNLEDVSPSAGVYRWTAQSPSFSVINLFTGGLLYSSRPSGGIPLRLAQVREAIFFSFQMPGPQASVRTGKGFLNGIAQNCILVAIGAGSQSFSGGRNWEESEYCMDANTGLLTTYSPVPGLFVHYDYSSGTNFHGKMIPSSFTITEGGHTVIEARTVSVKDPTGSNDSVFSIAGLQPLGVGRAMNPHSRFRSIMQVPSQVAVNQAPGAQVVVLIGSVSQEGRVLESEVISSTRVDLNQLALDRVNNLTLGNAQAQPGVTPQSREMFFTLEFVPPGE